MKMPTTSSDIDNLIIQASPWTVGCQEPFFEKDYDTENFDEIQVPSVWQMAGYDTHQYTNIRYPFPFDPPYVPQDIPCGTYAHTFVYHKDEKCTKSFLEF
jgi:beta-galactosidase